MHIGIINYGDAFAASKLAKDHVQEKGKRKETRNRP